MRFGGGKKGGGKKVDREAAKDEPRNKDLPRPTAQFRRRAWTDFQRALDPLAPPKPLRHPQH